MNSNHTEVMPEIKMVSLDKLHKNPKNPRIIKDDKFKKLVNSIILFPKMTKRRQIVYDETGMILGGNMRYEAILYISKMSQDEITKILKSKYTGQKIDDNISVLSPLFNGVFPDGWCVCADEFDEEEKQEFIIKDNVAGGEWGWDKLANKWDVSELEEWGLDVIKPVKIFGDTSTDREKQGVNSTWDAVKSSENVKIIIGQLESSIPSVLAKKIILYLENKFDNDEIPIKESIITVLECGINNFED